MTERKTVFHIGYPKAGSTTLQKHLFNEHSEINNLGIFPTQSIGRISGHRDNDCEYLKNPRLRRMYDDMVMIEGIQYDNRRMSEFFNKYIRELVASSEVNVFSNERFTSVFFAHDDLRDKARRIQEIAPDAKILIIIRNQFDLIKSQYRDHPMDPRSFAIGKPVSIDEWIRIARDSNAVHFLDSLQYHNVIHHYKQTFGNDRVEILLLEELAQDTFTFSKRLAHFIEIDQDEVHSCLVNKKENEGVSQFYNEFRRIRQRLIRIFDLPESLPKSVQPMMKSTNRRVEKYLSSSGNKERYTIADDIKGWLEDYYTNCNLQLDELYNLPVRKYGYPIVNNNKCYV